MYKRTHKCGDLRSSDLNEEVFLNGWVHKVRQHGQIVFVDLRDRFGKVQLVFDSTTSKGDFELVKKLSMEDVLSIKGTVRSRGVGAENPNLKLKF
jgi:aspartyl-tRNA synthetase